MHKLLIPALLFCMFTGCVQTQSRTLDNGVRGNTKRAFWGRKKEKDGTEYFRMGKLLIKTGDG